MRRFLNLLICFFTLGTINAQVYIFSASDSAAVEGAVLTAKGVRHYADYAGKVHYLLEGREQVVISHSSFDTLVIEIENGARVYLNPHAVSLDPVVYCGNLNERKTAREVLNNTKVIKMADIRNSGSQNLGDILKYQPNIMLSNDPVLGTSVSINGMSGQNVKLLKNGAAISGTMNGSVDVSQINVGNAGQIEIIEGPMSLLYGSNALAGTINLVSRLPEKKNQLSAKAYTESSGIYNISTSYSRLIKKSCASFYIGRNFFDGWNPGNVFYQPVTRTADSSRTSLWKPREQYFAELNFLCNIGKRSDIRFNSDYLNEVILNKGKPTQPYFESAFDDYYHTRRSINSAEINIKTSKVKHNILGSFTYFDRIKNTYFKDLTSSEKGTLAGADNQDTTRIYSSQLRYIASARAKSFGFNWGVDANQETFMGKRVLSNQKSIYNVSFVGIVSWTFRKHDLKFGIRQTIHSLNKIPLIPSLSTKFRLSQMADLKVSAAMGYRTPGVKELYLYFVDVNHNIKGNENLKSESSVNYNIVFTQRKKINQGMFSLQLNAYYNTFKNLITLAAITPTEYTYINIGTSKSRGINTELRYDSKRWEVASQQAIISTSNNDLDNPVPAYFTTFNSSLRSSYKLLKSKNVALNTFINYFGKSPSLAYIDNKAVVMKAQDYWMIDLTASWNMTLRGHKMNLVFGGKNLGNVTNIKSGASSGGVHQSSTGQRLVSTGRTIFISLEYSL